MLPKWHCIQIEHYLQDICNLVYLFNTYLFEYLPPPFNLQACNATQRYCKACTQDPLDVGDRVEEPGGPAKPRMGSLHDPSARYLILLKREIVFTNDLKIILYPNILSRMTIVSLALLHYWDYWYANVPRFNKRSITCFCH